MGAASPGEVDTYLFNVDGYLDFWDILGDVSFQRWDINRLPHYSSHCELRIAFATKEAGEAVILR